MGLTFFMSPSSVPWKDLSRALDKLPGGSETDCMWTFNSRSGLFSHDGEAIANGYSGYGYGRNNPEMECIADVGPIPRGKWHITLPAFDHPHLGPTVMLLSPEYGTDTHRRFGFLIHGDSKSHPGLASHGCIILDKMTRDRISASRDSELEVTA